MNRLKINARKTLSAFLLGLCLATTASPQAFCAGTANYDKGVKLMKEKQYTAAISAFALALKENPRDQNSYYCLGTCYYQMRDVSAAKTYYSGAVKISAASPTGKAAMAALNSIEQQLRKTSTAPTSSGTTTDSTRGVSRISSRQGGNEWESTSDVGSTLPNDCRVRFNRRDEGNHLYIEAYLNNRPITVIFDTGAEGCVFGFNHLQQVGMQPPTGKPQGQAQGVGSGGRQDMWLMKTKMRIGNIERANFPICVQKNLGTEPLLGQTFFRDYHYTVETDSNQTSGNIHFVRAGGAKQSGSVYKQRETNSEVPFTREGKEMVVNVTINGKNVQMYFDTGAASVVLSGAQAKAAGIQIPEDAVEGISQGIAGETKSLNFPVRHIKMGPIEKQNFNISVIEDLGVKKGLLGQSFFGDWRYTIDSVNNLIKLKR